MLLNCDFMNLQILTYIVLKIKINSAQSSGSIQWQSGCWIEHAFFLVLLQCLGIGLFRPTCMQFFCEMLNVVKPQKITSTCCKNDQLYEQAYTFIIWRTVKLVAKTLLNEGTCIRDFNYQGKLVLFFSIFLTRR